MGWGTVFPVEGGDCAGLGDCDFELIGVEELFLGDGALTQRTV